MFYNKIKLKYWREKKLSNTWKDFLETPLRDGSKSTLSWQFL